MTRGGWRYHSSQNQSGGTTGLAGGAVSHQPQIAARLHAGSAVGFSARVARQRAGGGGECGVEIKKARNNPRLEVAICKLFYRIRRNDFHADERLLGHGPIAGMRGRGADFFQHFVALDELAERGVLAVKKTRVAVADEKLRAGGIRTLRTRHREHAANVWLVIELRLDLVTGTAGAPEVLLGIVLRVRVAALNHKTLDDTVKTGAVVETFFREVGEIFDVAGCNVRPEFENHFAGAGSKNSNFAHKFILVLVG